MSEIKTEDLISAVEKSLEQAIEKYDGQVQESKEAANEVRDEVKALAEKHSSLCEQSESLAAKFQEFEQNALTGMRGGSEKSETWGQKFVGSDMFSKFLSGETDRAKIEVKNTIIGEGGSPQDPTNTIVPEDRLAGIVPGAFRQLNLLDFVPMGATSSNQIQYTRENTYTNNAAETAEGASKPESALTFELVDDPVRTIAHWLKLSKQVLDDAPMLESYVDRRLRHGVRQRLETQIVVGNGTSPNISGLDQTGRHTDFTPTSGENQFESINRAKYAVIADDYVPNAVLMNPADFGAMERLQSTTNEFLAGNGAALSYINNGLNPVIWGLPVVVSNAVTEGKFFVFDSNAMQLFMRQGATVEMYEQDDTNVQSNLITVRAELRGALAVFQPGAIHFGDLTV